mgnify:FL=1
MRRNKRTVLRWYSHWHSHYLPTTESGKEKVNFPGKKRTVMLATAALLNVIFNALKPSGISYGAAMLPDPPGGAFEET